jgi:hypothetical protein
MKVKVKLTPKQKMVIDAKLKKAKQTRVVKAIAYNKNLSSKTKVDLITNFLNTK